MKCLKSRNAIIRERIREWELVKSKQVNTHWNNRVNGEANYNYDASLELIDLYNRLINRMYNLLKKPK